MQRLKVISLYIFLGLLAYMPLHIFLSTWVGSSLELLSFAKILKDIVLVAGVSLAFIAGGYKFLGSIMRTGLGVLIVLYAILTIIFALVKPTDLDAEVIAVVYNLRFLLYFIYAGLLVKMYAGTNLIKRAFIVAVASGMLVATLGVLQYVVLPDDILTHFGYSRENGVLPAFHIDNKPDLERVNSTVRDPNSFGSYMVIISLIAGSSVFASRSKSKKQMMLGVLLISLLALLLSFSRSAFIGLVAALFVSGGLYVTRGYNLGAFFARYKKLILTIFTVVIIGLVGLFALRNTYFVKNVVFHADESTTLEDPNELRLRFLRESYEAFKGNPLGYGPGTAGLASIINDGQTVILNENYYLQLLHEVGILGLLLFLSILLVLLVELHLLWSIKRNYYALALVGALSGLICTNLFVHIWSNEAVAYTFWGLAGVVIFSGQLDQKRASIPRRFIALNRHMSSQFDRYFVPRAWRIDGLKQYVHEVVPSYLKPNQCIYDVGGGKRPFVGLEVPRKKGMRVVGVDIDGSELKAAPKGSYDKTIVGDIGSKKLKLLPEADIVICEAVLEHVENTEQAIVNIQKMTKVGGRAVLYIPSKNALFAIANRILPENLKRGILHTIFPEAVHAQGFHAYYNHCSPGGIEKLLKINGFRLDKIDCYYYSNYFSFFTPFHICWRIYQRLLFTLTGSRACESFSVVATKI